MKPIVVNLFAGPGAGKSTTAAAVFALLKLHGVNCELITEFAKDLTWEQRYKTLKNQLYIMAKQHHRMWRLKDEVDVIVTDSPLMLSLIYRDNIKTFVRDTILHYSDVGFKNFNYFIDRKKDYNPKGRNQTEKEALLIDKKILEMFDEYNIDHRVVSGDFSASTIIVVDILHKNRREETSHTCGRGGTRLASFLKNF